MSAIPHSTAGMLLLLLLLLPPRNRRSSINDRQHGSQADLDKSAVGCSGTCRRCRTPRRVL